MSANLTALAASENFFYPVRNRKAAAVAGQAEAPRLIADKLVAPNSTAAIRRERLHQQLNKTIEQFNATLVCGRAGTGKTWLAADFANDSERDVAWYTIESGDGDWTVFSSYLAESCLWHQADCRDRAGDLSNKSDEISQTTELLGDSLASAARSRPLLIVLDDAHSVFDHGWFPEFFQTLLPLLGADVHLLMLARSLPPLPLWRMRSKQMLGVIDEDSLAFTLEETIGLFARYNLSAASARLAHAETHGRAAKIKQSIESFSANAANWVL